MRYRTFLLIGFVLGFALYLRWKAAPPRLGAPEAPAAEIQAPMVASHPNPNRPPARTQAKAKVAALPSSAAQGNRVAFKVVGGLAIAYGDIILGQPESPEVQEGYYEATTPTLWDRPEIPFAIQTDLPNPQRVRTALDYLSRHTPLTFVPYDTQPDAIVFERGDQDCYSLLGKQGGPQPIRLSGECQWQQIAHEILHALGFVHEQSRTDRDQYVEILWDNIDPKYRAQFDKVPDSFMEASRQTAFDYRSVMLYPTDMFAAQKGQPTMRSRTGQAIAPTSSGLSPADIERINQMYRPYSKGQ